MPVSQSAQRGRRPATRMAADPPSESAGSPAVRAKALVDLEAREQACTNCDLFRRATQVVPGRGALTARLMLVGEQPGDQEDRAGEPFVGPAGQVLAEALARAGIERRAVFVTNAVKHFKWEPRGKRRIHQKPRWSEIRACRPWLDAELALIAAPVIVALGATAGQALLVPAFGLPPRWDRYSQDQGAELSSRPIIRQRSCELQATTASGCSANWSGIFGGLG